VRRQQGRLLGGVAAGVGDHLGIDPVIVRVAFVVLAFVPFPGFGLLVYGALVLLLPVEDERGAVSPSPGLEGRGAGFWVGIGLVGLATFWLLGAWGPRGGGPLFPLLLIGLGVALWVDADRRANGGGRGDDRSVAWGPPPAVVGSDAAADVPTERITPTGGEAGPPPPAPPAHGGSSPSWTPPPAPSPTPRSPLGRVTLGLALLAAGAVWLLDLLGIVGTIPASAVLAVALLVLGLGLLVGSIAGRARWLAFVVALLLPITYVAGLTEDLGVPLRAGVGDRVVVVTEASQVEDDLTLAAGTMVIDLTEVGRVPAGTEVVARVGAGELELRVPEGAGLEGHARVEVGESDVLGQRHDGFAIDREISIEADAGQPTYDLDLRVGAGELRVVRTAPESDR
jgi:phage shock protein PspC (stress-responsive transcriptional regulator)